MISMIFFFCIGFVVLGFILYIFYRRKKAGNVTRPNPESSDKGV